MSGPFAMGPLRRLQFRLSGAGRTVRAPDLIVGDVLPLDRDRLARAIHDELGCEVHHRKKGERAFSYRCEIRAVGIAEAYERGPRGGQ